MRYTAPGFLAFLARRMAHASQRDECWEWAASADKDGYGRVRYRGKTTIAHRAAYRILVGDVTAAEYLCHRCDNRACVNPAHLFVGDAKANYDDSRAKGRSSVGERNGVSKLSASDVRAIRADDRAQTVIAAEYGVGQTNISEIKRGRTWKHV